MWLAIKLKNNKGYFMTQLSPYLAFPNTKEALKYY